MPVRFVLIKLKPGVSVEDYEQFIQTFDYPVVPSLPAIRAYRTHRVSPEDKDPRAFAWDYVERIDIADREAYQAQVAASAGFAEFRRRLPAFVEQTFAFWAETLEPIEQAD